MKIRKYRGSAGTEALTVIAVSAAIALGTAFGIMSYYYQKEVDFYKDLNKKTQQVVELRNNGYKILEDDKAQKLKETLRDVCGDQVLGMNVEKISPILPKPPVYDSINLIAARCELATVPPKIPIK